MGVCLCVHVTVTAEMVMLRRPEEPQQYSRRIVSRLQSVLSVREVPEHASAQLTPYLEAIFVAGSKEEAVDRVAALRQVTVTHETAIAAAVNHPQWLPFLRRYVCLQARNSHCRVAACE